MEGFINQLTSGVKLRDFCFGVPFLLKKRTAIELDHELLLRKQRPRARVRHILSWKIISHIDRFKKIKLSVIRERMFTKYW